MDLLNLATIELKAYVPARDFELSKAFYRAMGFTLAWTSGELSYFHCGRSSFLLQNFHVQEHADNFMMHMLVENVDHWHERITALGIADRFAVSVGKPEDRAWPMRDFVLFDPSGVLWRIAQNLPKQAES